jgi:FkbM family methyltransferase
MCASPGPRSPSPACCTGSRCCSPARACGSCAAAASAMSWIPPKGSTSPCCCSATSRSTCRATPGWCCRPRAWCSMWAPTWAFMALQYARLVPGGAVYAFEPTAYAYGKLQRNLSLNPELAGIVKPVQAFLSSGEGGDAVPTAYSSWRIDGSAEEGRHPIHGGTPMPAGEVPVTSLDVFCAAEGLQADRFHQDRHRRTRVRRAERGAPGAGAFPAPGDFRDRPLHHGGARPALRRIRTLFRAGWAIRFTIPTAAGR